MCNTMCNNHTHEEYNVDYISQEEALDIQSENVPCQHEQNIYVIDGEYDENGCNCNKCSKCSEPKKVSCRSLACRQLNDECSCKRNKKKIRRTTMVNVLENNVLRLENKMNSGCADMHESIEDLEENVNKVYNELKDEEARAKQQEAFLHYGLDDAVTRAWYNPEDRKIHFYHKNPENCLNVNVHEGCDCDCCNACGCECKCNNDKCQSDIPYTMDDDCNIIPMIRDEEELPFSIDCTDFLRDIFVSNAYLEEGLVDPEGDVTHQFLIIEFTRWLEPDIERDDDQSVTPHTIRIDLTELWKLDNYYDKWKIDEIVAAIYRKIAEEVSAINNRINNEVNLLNTTINNTKTELNNTIDNTKNLINNTINETKTELLDIINNLNFDPTVEDYHNVCNYGEETVIASVNNTNITVKMPAEPSPSTPSSNVTILDAMLQWGSAVKYGTIDGLDVKITLPLKPAEGQGGVLVAVTDVTYNLTTNQLTIIYSEGDPKVIQLSGGDCLWKETSDGLIPVEESRKVYGYGFYDTAVNN